ncbi:hypothetical protein FB2170_09466 [Maribacter sp. HTCC2170]|nr:hypothetical protein FB2170_09466 [Maribacter sp. HTCC2170]
MWQHQSPGGWHFVSLPMDLANEIRKNIGWQEEGWGRLKAMAKIGDNKWQTAIWYDTKKRTYLLPIKAEIRKKEALKTESTINTVIWV